MNCKIIQDLLPLYRDEVCSQESRQAVDEHIQSCPHCAEVLREMGREENLDRETADVDREKAQVIAGVKRRFSRRKRLSVLATAAAMLAMFLVFTAAADVERPVPYQEGMVDASLASDGAIDIYYYGEITPRSGYWTGRSMDGRRSICAIPKISNPTLLPCSATQAGLNPPATCPLGMGCCWTP